MLVHTKGCSSLGKINPCKSIFIFLSTFWAKICKIISVPMPLLNHGSTIVQLSLATEMHCALYLFSQQRNTTLTRRRQNAASDYLMLLQDFMVDRSSAHRDGSISSHWMSRSILEVELGSENGKSRCYFCCWLRSKHSNTPQTHSQSLDTGQTTPSGQAVLSAACCEQVLGQPLKLLTRAGFRQLFLTTE